MRTVARPALLTLLVVLAGCTFAVAPGSVADGSATDAGGAAADSHTTAAPNGDGQETDTAGADGEAPTATERPDPETDKLGWENGYWYDDPVAADNADGLNESELDAVVARAMARVEHVRRLEFESTVPVEVLSREEFGAQRANRSTSEGLRAFDNAKFEALFMIGEREGSIAVQEQARSRTILGQYSHRREAIIVVSDAATPRLNGETTLAHELVHALQDQHFDLARLEVGSRDAYNGRNGLVEGDATYVEDAYDSNCGENWTCLASAGDGSNASAGAEPPHLGVYFMEYFPYETGPKLIEHLLAQGGWAAVDDAYDAPPTSSRAVIDPTLYGSFEPRDVSLAPDARDGWERIRPPDRPDYAVMGPSALASAFAYTLYDSYDRRGVIEPGAFLNLDSGLSINRSDPLTYALPFLEGWAGERFHAYRRGEEGAYVWRLAWETPADAERFADAYRRLLRHWGGSRVGGGAWRVADDSPFADAFHLAVDGDTVTVANAPSVDDLPDVYAGAR